eukprot:jgi/Chrpa1/21106/Chrysochromulina_OHIO_Genome00004557-RA
MIGALGSSLLRAAPATHASLFRPLPMAAPHAARGIAAAALPHRIAVRRAPLARLLSGEADRTVVEKATTLIKKALSPKEVKIQGAYDDPNGSHITVYVVSEAFEGKRSLARQQLVNKALWDLLSGSNAPVHAIDQMILKAPSEL